MKLLNRIKWRWQHWQIKRRAAKIQAQVEHTSKVKVLRVEDIDHSAWKESLREFLENSSILWQWANRRRKPAPTLREAAMEADTLLTNYLYNEHFPKGSDCEVVRDMLRRALGHRQKLEREISVESTVPGAGEGIFKLLMVEDDSLPADTVYMLPKGIADAINNGSARILKL